MDTHDSLSQPPTITLRSLDDGAQIATIFDARDPRIDELALAPPELVSLQSRDGVTLHGAIFRPPARFGPGPYPTLVQVYGGPHAQTVTEQLEPDGGDARAISAQPGLSGVPAG